VRRGAQTGSGGSGRHATWGARAGGRGGGRKPGKTSQLARVRPPPRPPQLKRPQHSQCKEQPKPLAEQLHQAFSRHKAVWTPVAAHALVELSQQIAQQPLRVLIPGIMLCHGVLSSS
jgi:hypothetical protein